MKPFFAALVILAVAFPAASQSNTAPAHSSEPAGAPSEVPLEPLSQRAQQASDSCPALMARTESAIANGHVASFAAANCDCLAQSIDYNTWDDASASYSGPKMLDSDADLIVSAIATSSTLEDAFAAVDGSISEAGFSATSACYNK
jgi:hypothetical protein